MSDLMEAIKIGDLLTISALATPFNINHYDLRSKDITPLIGAIRHNQIDAVKLLIQLGADIRVDSCLSYNPITFAIENNNLEMAELLINNGIELNKGRMKPLNQAVILSNTEAASFLLARGADINLKTTHCKFDPAILTAAEHGNIKMIAWLLDHGAIADTYGLTPQNYIIGPYEKANNTSALFKVIKSGHLEAIQLLLEAGAGISEDISPLHIAVLQNDLSKMKILLADGLSPNITNETTFTPFHYALYLNNIEALELLKQYGADLSLKIDSGYEEILPMEIALLSNATKASLWLLENGVDIYQKYTHDETALSYAASEGNIELVNILLDKGANVNDLNDHGESVLYAATYSNNPDMIKLLVDKGAPLNIQNEDGRTEFFHAAFNILFNECDSAMLKILLELGADPSIKDNRGQTALEYFKMLHGYTTLFLSDYDAICKILEPHENAINHADVLQSENILDNILAQSIHAQVSLPDFSADLQAPSMPPINNWLMHDTTVQLAL